MSILSTSLSALRVSQRVLETTSHNIANVNTPGYSRQRVSIGTQEPSQFGFGSVGNGARINNIQRVYDQFLGAEVTNNLSEYHRLDAFAGLAGRLGNLMNNPETGLAANMQSFFSTAADVANDPASITAREAMLGETRVVIAGFNETASQLDSIDQEVSARIAQEVRDIDALGEAIARINDQIALAGGASANRQPNDLLDRRDEMVDELASKVAIATSLQDDGSLNVFLGSGQALVLGTSNNKLSTQSDPIDPARVTVQLGPAGSRVDVSDSISGGTLGGLLDFSREGLDSARNQLGQIATAFALDVNARHGNGMDLDGNLGGDFFTIADPEVLTSSDNTGSASLTAQIGDLSSLGAEDFRIRFDGAAFTINSEQTGAAVPFTGAGTPGDPLVFGGVEVVVSGAPAPGDDFLLRPTGNAAASMALALNSGREIAAAFPVRAGASSDNGGSGAISIESITNPDNPSLLDDLEIEFLDANTYQVNGAGSFTYTPGDPISVNGYEVVISGAAQAGDTFTVESNVGGIGDNRNMLAIGKMVNEGILDGGRATLNDAVGTLVAQAGISGREANRGLEAQGVLLEQSQIRELQVSGVNLDEEAANLLQFQRSYEAAAQMIAVADSLFATLINAVGR